MKTKIKIIASLIVTLLSLASCSESSDPKPATGTTMRSPAIDEVPIDQVKHRNTTE